MFLKRILAKNFGSYEELDIDFTQMKPITVITGMNLDEGDGASNGAGKSTLIKILAGYHHPAEGEVLLGEDVVPPGARLARELGLRFVHQDLALVDSLDQVPDPVECQLDLAGFDTETEYAETKRCLSEFEYNHVEVLDDQHFIASGALTALAHGAELTFRDRDVRDADPGAGLGHHSTPLASPPRRLPYPPGAPRRTRPPWSERSGVG